MITVNQYVLPNNLSPEMEVLELSHESHIILEYSALGPRSDVRLN